jgi:hypothetical protein
MRIMGKTDSEVAATLLIGIRITAQRIVPKIIATI